MAPMLISSTGNLIYVSGEVHSTYNRLAGTPGRHAATCRVRKHAPKKKDGLRLALVAWLRCQAEWVSGPARPQTLNSILSRSSSAFWMMLHSSGMLNSTNG